MTQDQIKELFEKNILELNKMYIPAGSMVKGLIQELERNNRNTYIKLYDAAVDGHLVHYDFVEGNKDLVINIAKALGFKNVTSDLLEVNQ